MNNSVSTHVVTGRVRLSYCSLFTPKQSQFGGDAKYSVTVLVPKSDTATMQRINAAIEAATVAGVAKKWNGQRPPILKTPVHDGDGVRPSDGMPFGDECKGCWVFTASNTLPPKIVDANLNPIIDQTEVYSGMYGRVGVDFFAYANTGSRGVGCSLGNVQKLEDGEPLAGRSASVEEDFGVTVPVPQAYGGTAVPPWQAAPANAGYAAPAPAAIGALRYNPLTGAFE